MVRRELDIKRKEKMPKHKQQEPQLSDPISPHWQKFFEQGKEIATLPINEWRPVHLISYFCGLYEKQYGITYTMKSFSQAPGKSYESFRIKSLATNLSADPVILKDYIDWVFREKVILRKKKIRSLAILCDANYISEYKEDHLGMGDKPVDRSTTLPPNFANVIKAHNQPFMTWGDLSFAKQAGNQYDDLLSDLSKAGMDLKMLDRVK
jgi:hypothetical protein